MATETSRTFKGFRYQVAEENDMPAFDWLADLDNVQAIQLVGGFIDVTTKHDEDTYEHIIFNSEGLQLFSYVQTRNYIDEVREVA